MIPEVKQVIRSVSMDKCNQVARKVLTMNSHRQVENFLRDSARKILPEIF
jgi:phosphoenolpyruvate-protein kinase (PTS system EI component)